MTEREKLEAELYVLDKQHSHLAGALASRLTPHDREITKNEFEKLSRKILALEEHMKSLAS